LIKRHLEGKTTDSQRERFIQSVLLLQAHLTYTNKLSALTSSFYPFMLARLPYLNNYFLICRHLRRYLLPLTPISRLEIHTTSRYTSVSGHTELAVFTTRNLPSGAVLQELQGSVVPLPDAWREEMEIGEDFAVRAAGEETSNAGSESGDDDPESVYSEVSMDESDVGAEYVDDLESMGEEESVVERRKKGKGKERESERTQRGARRSDRTKRRDFSIVWSGLKRCFQLFLGPARFLNVSEGKS